MKWDLLTSHWMQQALPASRSLACCHTASCWTQWSFSASPTSGPWFSGGEVWLPLPSVSAQLFLCPEHSGEKQTKLRDFSWEEEKSNLEEKGQMIAAVYVHLSVNILLNAARSHPWQVTVTSAKITQDDFKNSSFVSCYLLWLARLHAHGGCWTGFLPEALDNLKHLPEKQDIQRWRWLENK